VNEAVTILGAGLTGISAAYHTGHDQCISFEAKDYTGGHIFSHITDGYTWDEGPHVSFTKHNYVKELFAKSLDGNFLEFPVFPTNYYKGHWIPHPAQSNLYAVPEPLRTNCLEDFLQTRTQISNDFVPANYAEWLEAAFGKTFAHAFPFAYTEKYWTIPPEQLETNWVGERVFYPAVEQVKQGFEGPLPAQTHYISSIRYPASGGYHSFASLMEKGLQVVCNKKVTEVDLKAKTIFFSDKTKHSYRQLVSTLPLPDFIGYCNAPAYVQEAASALSCSQLLLLNFEVNHSAIRSEQWLYVYDADKYSTRINFIELLSPQNVPADKGGIQVEVYFSKYRTPKEETSVICDKVAAELVEMGLVKTRESIARVTTQWIPYANVIFDHYYRNSMDTILQWLSTFGLVRESDDLLPMTDWDKKMNESFKPGDIILGGRFGQWKYYWTDDCVLRGKLIGNLLGNK
jgi:protoporphyrinogen oxidase